MTLPEQMIRVELLNSRITRINALYAHFYGPLCLLVISLTFFPYYESEPHSSINYGNLWQEVFRLGPSFDLMALVILLLTALLLAGAAVGNCRRVVSSRSWWERPSSVPRCCNPPDTSTLRPTRTSASSTSSSVSSPPAWHWAMPSTCSSSSWRSSAEVSECHRVSPREQTRHCASRPRSASAGTTCRRVSGAN